MCRCVGDEWLYDIQDSDVERFQFYLPHLMMIFGLNQDDVGLILNVSRQMVSRYINNRFPLPVPHYAYLRMWMQCKSDNGDLQNDALYYFMHRKDEHKIIRYKRHRLLEFTQKYFKQRGIGSKKLREKMDRDWAAEFGGG